MHVIRNTEEIRKFIGEKKTAVALGAFDGLHIGHYKVIRTAVESGLTPVVFTFRDNPAEYLTGTCCYLTTVEERMRILESWGVEYVIMPDFAQVAEWPAERFANLLRCGLNARNTYCFRRTPRIQYIRHMKSHSVIWNPYIRHKPASGS